MKFYQFVNLISYINVRVCVCVYIYIHIYYSIPGSDNIYVAIA